ncbi:probable magnesium transporter NIPA2, partial [Notothenia coriiceps]|uniref:Probable magnesium transporter NIPA2 n=1 Tax=Notothenia coriiceps TaxID=8208 RepID=A0A6I9NB58_9TELE
FLVYLSAVLLLCSVLVFYFSPRVGRSNILVYISVCSLLGAFTVASVKGLAIAINTVVGDVSVLKNPLTWILLVTLIVSIVTQVNYLNKSLDTFNTLMVYPIYYVLFTSVVLSTSIILFQEWRSMKPVDVVTTLGSFLVIVVGVAMLHFFKELQCTMKQRDPNSFGLRSETGGAAEEVSANAQHRQQQQSRAAAAAVSRNKKEDIIRTDGQHGDRESSSHERKDRDLHHQLKLKKKETGFGFLEASPQPFECGRAQQQIDALQKLGDYIRGPDGGELRTRGLLKEWSMATGPPTITRQDPQRCPHVYGLMLLHSWKEDDGGGTAPRRVKET